MSRLRYRGGMRFVRVNPQSGKLTVRTMGWEPGEFDPWSRERELTLWERILWRLLARVPPEDHAVTDERADRNARLNAMHTGTYKPGE